MLLCFYLQEKEVEVETNCAESTSAISTEENPSESLISLNSIANDTLNNTTNDVEDNLDLPLETFDMLDMQLLDNEEFEITVQEEIFGDETIESDAARPLCTPDLAEIIGGNNESVLQSGGGNLLEENENDESEMENNKIRTYNLNDFRHLCFKEKTPEMETSATTATSGGDKLISSANNEVAEETSVNETLEMDVTAETKEKNEEILNADDIRIETSGSKMAAEPSCDENLDSKTTETKKEVGEEVNLDELRLENDGEVDREENPLCNEPAPADINEGRNPFCSEVSAAAVSPTDINDMIVEREENVSTSEPEKINADEEMTVEQTKNEMKEHIKTVRVKIESTSADEDFGVYASFLDSGVVKEEILSPKPPPAKKTKPAVVNKQVTKELSPLEKKLLRRKEFKMYILNQPVVVLEDISKQLSVTETTGATDKLEDQFPAQVKPKKSEEEPEPKPAVKPKTVAEKKVLKMIDPIPPPPPPPVVEKVKPVRKLCDISLIPTPKPAGRPKQPVSRACKPEEPVCAKVSAAKPAKTAETLSAGVKQQKIMPVSTTVKANSEASAGAAVKQNPAVSSAPAKSTSEPVATVKPPSKTGSYPKLTDLVSQMKKCKEEQVSKTFWGSKPAEQSADDTNSTTDDTAVATTAPSPIPGLGMRSVPASYLANFKIKKVDVKEKPKPVDSKPSPAATAVAKRPPPLLKQPIAQVEYVSPLDKIMAESNRYTKSGQRTNQENNKDRKNKPDDKGNANKDPKGITEKRRSIEEARREFEKSVNRNDKIVNFTKEILNVLRNVQSGKQPSSSASLTPNSTTKYQSNSSTTPLSPSASVCSSGGDRTTVDQPSADWLTSVKQQLQTSSLSLSTSGTSARKTLLDNAPLVSAERPKRPPGLFDNLFQQQSSIAPAEYSGVRSFSNRNIPLLGNGPPEYIWDGTKEFVPDAEVEKPPSTQKKALLKPPLLITSPGQSEPVAENVLKQSSLFSKTLLPDPIVDARQPKMPKTPPSPSYESRHRTLLPGFPDLLSALTNSNAFSTKKPSLLETPDLFSILTSNTKKPSLLRTPLLPSLPACHQQTPVFDTKTLLSMINPNLLGKKPLLSAESKGNLTISDAQAYLLATMSAGVEEDEPVEEEPFVSGSSRMDMYSVPHPPSSVSGPEENNETLSSENLQLLQMVNEISSDESALQDVLKEVLRGLSHSDDGQRVSPPEEELSSSAVGPSSSSCAQSEIQTNNDVTQLKGILITLLNDPSSILQTDNERRHKTESLIPILNEMEHMDAKNLIFVQCDILSPIMTFAKEVIELSES